MDTANRFNQRLYDKQNPKDLASGLERLNDYVENATGFLLVWHHSEDSDSTGRQEQRVREYGQAAELLREAVRAAPQFDQQIRIVTAEDSQPFTTKIMAHGRGKSIDIMDDHRPDSLIRPGSAFVLDEEMYLAGYLVRRARPFFGSGSRFLEASDIANILASGGRLEVADAAPDPPDAA